MVAFICKCAVSAASDSPPRKATQHVALQTECATPGTQGNLWPWDVKKIVANNASHRACKGTFVPFATQSPCKERRVPNHGGEVHVTNVAVPRLRLTWLLWLAEQVQKRESTQSPCT